MRFVAGLDLDAGVGPERAAAVGEIVGSPAALLGSLEVRLGLAGPVVTLAERAAWLLPRLSTQDGFWSPSFEIDPWGTAIRLVRDRDSLTAEGWKGAPVSARWDALWAVTEGIPVGRGDRWMRVCDTLGSRSIGIEAVELVDPWSEWPGAMRRVLERLQWLGVSVREVLREPVGTVGDLAGARTDMFRPAADGSLQLVRAQGAAGAAEDVGAWLAECGDPASTLIVSPDATLDAGLYAAGLPTTGGPSSAGTARAALQVLPLLLEMIWAPAEPQAALDLLSLPATPIPRPLARRLADALRQWPALGSEDWEAALAEHDYGEDTDVAARRRERVSVLLTPEVSRDREAIPMDVLRRRIQVSAAWVRARARADGADDAAIWQRVHAQHRTLSRLLEGLDHPEVPAPLLARLVVSATEAATRDSPWPARAGLRCVERPGGVIRPADTIIWWNFSRDAAPATHGPDLTRAERAALSEAGIEVPTAGERAMWAARRWRRPLSMAKRRLLLITPKSSAPGEAIHPHPLWDEIMAAVPERERKAGAAKLQHPLPGLTQGQRAARSLAEPVTLPRYVAEWDVPAGSLAPRECESPSGLAALVGCSLRWALKYPLRVTDAHATYRLSVGARERGNLAHAVLAEVLRVVPADADTAEAGAGAVFDEIGPRCLAPLFLPGGDADREELRGVIVRSAGSVVRWLHAHELVVEAVEEDVEREFEGRLLRGRVDLLAGPPRVVVDFKLGGRTKRRVEIERGTAYQLACYAHAAAAGGKTMPEYAYFIVLDQLLVGRKGGPFGEHTTVDGPPPLETWQRFHTACRHRLGEVAAGTLRSPGGLVGVPTEPVVDGDRLALPPGCSYCSYDALCGLAFSTEGER